MDLAQRILLCGPKKQCTFYPKEPLGMSPGFRISSSPGSTVAKLSEPELD